MSEFVLRMYFFFFLSCKRYWYYRTKTYKLLKWFYFFTYLLNFTSVSNMAVEMYSALAKKKLEY